MSASVAVPAMNIIDIGGTMRPATRLKNRTKAQIGHNKSGHDEPLKS